MFLSVHAFLRPTTANILTRISTTSTGAQAEGGSFENAHFSPNGRYLMFDSDASNLAGGGVAGDSDVFLKDMLTGQVTLISTGLGGAVPNDYSLEASFSSDGRYVVFSSEASNLVAGDNNNVEDIFIKDLATGKITLVSTKLKDGQGNGDSYNARLSPDGRYVVFTSDSTNFDGRDTDNVGDIYLKDLVTGSLSLLSITPQGTKANSVLYAPQFSPDGKYVMFYGGDTNLVPGTPDPAYRVFLKNLATGEITLVSSSASKAPANNFSFNGQFGAGGHSVVFESSATNLIDDDKNGGSSDIFLKDLRTGAITLLSTNALGEQANGSSSKPQLSRAGRYLVFESFASNLVEHDTNNTSDVFLKDLKTGQVTLLNKRTDGTQVSRPTGEPNISSDGRYVVFKSEASDLVPGDTNGEPDLFRIDLLYKANAAAIAEGRFVDAALATGNASQVSIAWGDGTTSSATPAGGFVSITHAYASANTKATAVVSLVEGALTWSVAHTVDLVSSTMVRNTALADTLSGGAGGDSLVGDGTADVLLGNSGNDRLTADAGHDLLEGGSGNDVLSASSGNDRLIGGTGKDTLTGGTGRDVFVFDDRETGSSKTKADYITDFSGRRGDRIDLKAVDANTKKRGDQKFSFIGDEESFSKAGEVRFEKTKSATYVYLNTDSDKAAEAVIKLKGSLELSKSWFVL